MEYSRFINEIKKFDFIGNEGRADALIKAVLGILASSMDDDTARKFTERLPEPLTFEKLRGHQARPVEITIEEFFSEIGAQFRINPEQAKTAVDAVFHLVKEAVGAHTLSEAEYSMPPDVAEEIEAA
ncbi:MAG: DUF2267 domain-containing protein [Deltaproteobacteria bacterium]|nr:DUF2267 domain-containing protein [Deltaproteobacteria bacterium]MBZ0219951.1 DUF2267 domain-containing protein [Deltaproteobacteria bacterium]